MTVASGLSWLLAWFRACVCQFTRSIPEEREGDAHLLDGAKDGEAEVFLACLLGADTSEELGTKLESLLAVEGGLGVRTGSGQVRSG
jgi:hypothetical protein